MDELRVVPTADGTSTLYSERFNATYHSVNGALTESMHVFIKSGFEAVLHDKKALEVLEVGMGTCLNAALTAWDAPKFGVKVHYTGIELLPPTLEVLNSTGYQTVLEPECAELWVKIVAAPAGHPVPVSPWFTALKLYVDFISWIPNQRYDLIYFDAFAPDDQPEMWNLESFRKLFDALGPNGALVTYSAKGMVKRNLRCAGFSVERLQGPPAKRHMVRAWKTPDH
ncbi:MAG TPA: SAM-dependent methyltransferase [Bacteroidales bacterium]|nr:SAM-dependent methyltransferase [Bacteroidales bacterium]